MLVNGEYVAIDQVQHELLELPVKVHNFQVEDYQTYYVSATGVLVHNACSVNAQKFDEDQQALLKLVKEKETAMEDAQTINGVKNTDLKIIELIQDTQGGITPSHVDRIFKLVHIAIFQ